jgi:hypothetical protein
MTNESPTAYAVPEDDQAFLEFVKDERWMHLIGMLIPPRPGVTEFMTTLEYTHFIPGTDRNELFQLRIWQWMDIAWVIVTIPRDDEEKARTVAKQAGLRLAPAFPVSVDPDGNMVMFPVQGENVFTLENQRGHPVYKNDPAQTRAMLEAEFRTARHISGQKEPTS